MKVLTFTTVFPNAVQPTHGLFVLERVRHTARLADVRLVAPVSWRSRPTGAVPRRVERDGLVVEHPTFFYLPGILKVFDGLFLFLSVLAIVTRVRREFDFDLIDAHFTFPEGFAAVLLGKWFRRPVTITARGTLIPLSTFRLRRWAMQWTLRRADRVIAVAHPLAERAHAMGVPTEHIVVIPNGVDFARFSGQSQHAARLALRLAPDVKLVVSVGHLSHRKGFHRVLQVLSDVARHVPNVRLAIVGGPGVEGDVSRQLRDLIDERRLADRVVLTGALEPALVARWLSAADLFVLASDYEGCPNVVLEAMAAGKPIVATRVGEVGRMVPPYAGILIDDADDLDALRRSIVDGLTQEWNYEQIRAYARHQTWDDVAEQVLEQWQRAIGGRAPRAIPCAAHGNRLNVSIRGQHDEAATR